MPNRFDINALFEQVFGRTRGVPYDSGQILSEDVTDPEPGFDLNSITSSDQGEFVQMRQTLGGKLPTGEEIFMPVQVGGLLLPNEPTVRITGRKRITSTPMAGSRRKGSVLELIATDNYRVVIRGIAINYDNNTIYPEDTVKAIHDLCLRNESLEVQSAITNLFGIYRLVIENYDFPEMMGVQHAQAYELSCISDEDFTLEIEA
jgi:hypothetical protein